MTLQQGIYSIVSRRTTHSLPFLVGRAPIEDISLRPKKIYALPDTGLRHYPHWILTPKDDYSLEIKAFECPVGAAGGRLVAFVNPYIERQAKWVALPTGNDDEYTIELADFSAAWVVSDEVEYFGAPLNVRPLSGMNKDTEVFIIRRLGDVGDNVSGIAW